MGVQFDDDDDTQTAPQEGEVDVSAEIASMGLDLEPATQDEIRNAREAHLHIPPHAVPKPPPKRPDGSYPDTTDWKSSWQQELEVRDVKVSIEDGKQPGTRRVKYLVIFTTPADDPVNAGRDLVRSWYMNPKGADGRFDYGTEQTRIALSSLLQATGLAAAKKFTVGGQMDWPATLAQAIGRRVRVKVTRGCRWDKTGKTWRTYCEPEDKNFIAIKED